jgi:diguanylate cyclase (GGDEF)-like protein
MTPRLTGILLQFFLANGVMVALLSSLAYVQRRLLQLRTMAYVDFLTSLPNRRYLDEKLRRFDASGADGVSVVMFDVDHFKSVNDTYGHHVGDHVLREIALVAAGHLRDGQLLGRWGGEEFVLLLPDQDEETAARIVERVRRALDTHTFAGGRSRHGEFRRGRAASPESPRRPPWTVRTPRCTPRNGRAATGS